MILKKGSKGSDVVILQEALIKAGYSLVADGDFGAKTDSVLKDYQRKIGLYPDGIAGEKTFKALKIFGYGTTTNVESKCIDPSVVYAPLSVHVSKKARTPKYLAIHYTAGGSSAPGRAKAIKSIFEKRSASADFAVDDQDMVQFNPDLKNYYCWAVGDTKNKYTKNGAKFNGKAYNSNTISIEICSNLKKGTSSSAANHDGWYFTDETLANAVKLAKIIMKKFNIDIDHVVRHYDITGKMCPGVPGWNSESLYDAKTGKSTKELNTDSAWKKFKEQLK